MQIRTSSRPERMSILLSMIELTLLTATAYRSGTASNQATRRRRTVVVPNSRPRSMIPSPVSSSSSLAQGPAPARAGAARYRVRGRHERIAAVVEIEQGSLRAFEQEVLASSQHFPDQLSGVGKVRLDGDAPP